MNRKVVQSLKTLKAIKPDPAWTASTRDILLSQISAQGLEAAPHSLLGAWWVYTSAGLSEVYRYTIGVLFASPRNAFATMVLLFGVSIALASASGGSLPGEPLYAVKKTTEAVRVAFVSPDERAGLESELAERRLQELKDISHKDMTAEAKAAAVESLAQEASENISSVSRNLDSLKSRNESKKVAAVAGLITERAGAYKSLIAQAQTQSGALDEVGLKVDEADRKAFEMIVEKQVEAGITEEDLSGQLEKRVKATEEELAALTKKVAAAGGKQGAGEGSRALVEKSDAAQRRLDETRSLLVRKDFKTALVKLNETRQLVLSMASTLRKSTGDADVKERGAEERKPSE
ncbi:MAG: DUF5667 domain-containing protein [Patescibacteria group bacterium]